MSKKPGVERASMVPVRAYTSVKAALMALMLLAFATKSKPAAIVPKRTAPVPRAVVPLERVKPLPKLVESRLAAEALESSAAKARVVIILFFRSQVYLY